MGLGFFGGAGGGTGGLQKVADAAARLALTTADGLTVLQLDTDEIWEYDGTSSAWRKLAGLVTNGQRVAGYNSTKEPYEINSWQIDSTTDGFLYNKTLSLDDSGGNTVYAGLIQNVNVTPNSGIYSDTYSVFHCIMHVSGTEAVETIYGNYISVNIDTSNTAGQIFGNSVNTAIGVNVTAVNSLVGYGHYGSLEGVLSNGVEGFATSPAFEATVSCNYFNAFAANPSIDMALNAVTGVSIYNYGSGSITNFTGAQFSPGVNVTNYTGVSAGSNTTTITNYTGFSASVGASGSNYNALNTSINGTYSNILVVNGNVSGAGAGTVFTGATFSPSASFSSLFLGVQVNPSGGGSDFYGYSTSPSGTYTNNVVGVEINLDTVVCTGNPAGRKTCIQAQGGSVNFYGTFTTVSSANTDTINGMNPTLLINSGSPITGTTVFMHNMAGLITANDNIDAGGIGRSVGVVCYVGQFSVAAGKTVDSVSLALAGANVSGPGTITHVTLFDAIGGIDGGSADVTNLYGFRFSNALGLAPTNMWGLYIDHATAENYIGGSLCIGTTTKKVTNGSIGFEIGGTDKALRLPVLTTAQKTALTAVEGMHVFDSDTASVSTYNGTDWVSGGDDSMTTVQRDALTPATGRRIYNTDTKRHEYYDGTLWQSCTTPNIAAAQTPADASTPTILGYRRQVLPISGSGGAVTLTDLSVSNNLDGDELVLLGTSDTNTVTVVAATNTVVNGSCTLASGNTLTLVLYSGKWYEKGRG